MEGREDEEQHGEEVASSPEAIVLYDGVCAVCNTLVNFVIDRDPKGRIAFASLQSEKGLELLEKYHIKADLDTMVLVKGEQAYTHSTAVLRTMQMLIFPWYLLTIFLLVPWFVRDFCYKCFASVRYRLFGKIEACRRPTAEMRRRFLDIEDSSPTPSGSNGRKRGQGCT